MKKKTWIITGEIVTGSVSGILFRVLVNCEERRIQQYMTEEMRRMAISFREATQDDIEAARQMGLPINLY